MTMPSGWTPPGKNTSEEDEYAIDRTKDSDACDSGPEIAPQLMENANAANVLKYERILLRGTGEYYGGHKKFLAGGYMSEKQYGAMYLTENFFVFTKTDKKNPSKSWEIVIPFDSIIVDNYRIEEVARRSQLTGGGTGIDINGDGTPDATVGTAFLHSSGKAHHMVISFIDKNGIRHDPRFGISSLGGGAIQKWAAMVFDSAVDANRRKAAQQEKVEKSKEEVQKDAASHPARSKEPPKGVFSFMQKSVEESKSIEEPSQTQQPNLQHTQEDPIQVLKLRLVRGEITKDEYAELRRILES